MRKSIFCALFLMGIATVRADLIPSYVSATSSPAQQNTVYTYKLDVTAEQNANAGDFFTIYDFSTIAPIATSQPAGWTFSAQLIGVTASQTNPTDDTSLYNLTWTYTGSTIVGTSPAGQNIGPFSVTVAGNFNADFPPVLHDGQFTAQGTRATGPNVGTKVSNIGIVSIPVAVPEPSTIALIVGAGGLGVFGRALARRRR